MIRCVKFRPFVKNTLQAFVDLELTRVGIVIRDCCWHQRDGREWISFPAKSFEGKDGTKWAPMVEFAEGAREAREAFQQQAIDAIHAAAREATA